MPYLAASPQQLKTSARRLAEEVLNQGDRSVAGELIAPTASTVISVCVRREVLRSSWTDFGWCGAPFRTSM